MSTPLKMAIVVGALVCATAPIAMIQPANAQVEFRFGPVPPPAPMVPPRYGPYGDRDRDGIPNRYDSYPNQAWNGRDQDRDGIPNRYDRDRDGDGVPNRWDRRPGNPYRY